MHRVAGGLCRSSPATSDGGPRRPGQFGLLIVREGVVLLLFLLLLLTGYLAAFAYWLPGFSFLGWSSWASSLALIFLAVGCLLMAAFWWLRKLS